MNEFVEKMHRALDNLPKEELLKLTDLLLNNKDKQIFVFGNGGSWALAQHFAADLSKLGFKIICVPSSIAELTMWGNDDGYDTIFARPIQNLIKPKDIVVAISSSGNSSNVVKAIKHAKLLGGIIVGFSGFEASNTLNQFSDIKIHIPTKKGEYGVVETTHDAILHLLVEELKYGLSAL